MDDITGSTLLVTGGSAGLGAATAMLAAAAGARVAILDVNEAQGRDTAARANGKFYFFDASRQDSWSGIVHQIEQDLGPVRFAHLNAGIMTQPLKAPLGPARLEDVTLERFKAVMAVNVEGVFFGLQALIPRLIPRSGAITVTGSAAGLVPIHFDPVYALTKHAVIGLVRSTALAYAARTIRINALCPGGFSSALLPQGVKTEATMTPEDVAREVLDLLLGGETGEVRVKLSKERTAERVDPPDFSLG
ncbi:SDR family oxidoreductase [Iodidimonas sp. SYSU 1G8]|uniref:SDR family NAD(P)-dependent oxidoreductase n=1 Tax=Iodidimonas sp. SYSU 1G8 TaxID=3133967 RepID=UPI0031FEBA87